MWAGLCACRGGGGLEPVAEEAQFIHGSADPPVLYPVVEGFGLVFGERHAYLGCVRTQCAPGRSGYGFDFCPRVCRNAEKHVIDV